MEKIINWFATSSAPLFWFLALTFCWVLGVLAALGYALDIWSLRYWLSQIFSHIPAEKPTVSLGETGDFLTGWLQPLALTWFVITIFMQMRELRLQKDEFKKLVQEYEGNKIATQQQAEHQKQANTLNNRILVRSIIEESKNRVRRNTELAMREITRLIASSPTVS